MDKQKHLTTACTTFDFRISKEYKLNDEMLDLTVNDIRDMLNGLTSAYVFQLEKGNETGYVHYQGRFRLIKKTTLNNLKNLMRAREVPLLPNYLSPTVTKEHLKRSFNYQLKEDTRIAGPYKDNDILESDDSNLSFSELSKKYDVLQHLTSEDKLYPYQRTIIESSSKHDLRAIDVIYDPIGNNGKSTIKDYLDITRKAIIIPPTGDSTKLMEASYGIIKSEMDRIELKPDEIYRPGMILVDIPRSIKTAELYTFYGVLEQLKGGISYDFRYSFRRLRFQPPRIWIFTNTLPPPDCLSPDRMRIWTINESKELVKYEPDDDELI